jgi:xanthine dehydrogenase YagT iron-sulfur-binding subunit
VAALLGAVAPTLADEAEKERGTNAVGPAATPISLDINGKQYPLTIEPRVTLLDALRDRLGLTGTKRICDGGACGGCTVMVDGLTVNSCLMLAMDARGRKIRTIEGLELGGKLHPVQEAFIEHDAMQCGFCTPGMVMSCTALVESNANPDDAAIRSAVAGNLCRCGTYPHVFAAVKTASKTRAKSLGGAGR